MRRLACLLFLAACATQPQVANTPPPPDRAENVVMAYGTIRDPAGQPLQHARVRAWEADAGCDAGRGAGKGWSSPSIRRKN